MQHIGVFGGEADETHPLGFPRRGGGGVCGGQWTSGSSARRRPLRLRPRPAQNVPAPAAPRLWYSVNVVTVKRETAAEWREFQKTQSIPLQQRGGMKMRDTWASGAPFGDGLTFVLVTEIEKFADYDQPPLPQRLLTGEALRTYQATNQRLVTSNRMYAVQSRPELSIAPAAGATIMGAILTETIVVNGHADQYEAYLKNDLVPVLKKGNVLGYNVGRTVFGGNANEYHTLQYFDSYAEIDKGPVPGAGAGSGRRTNTAGEGHVSHRERQSHRASLCAGVELPAAPDASCRMSPCRCGLEVRPTPDSPTRCTRGDPV